jgi:hypothetical protein
VPLLRYFTELGHLISTQVFAPPKNHHMMHKANSGNALQSVIKLLQIKDVFLKILHILEDNLTIISDDFSSHQLPVRLQTNHQFCTM